MAFAFTSLGKDHLECKCLRNELNSYLETPLYLNISCCCQQWCRFCWVVSHLPQAQLIAQSIGQAFSVAYREFLRANGINPTDLSQKQYSDIINSQEMYHDDLIHFSNSDNCKEVCAKWRFLWNYDEQKGRFEYILCVVVMCRETERWEPRGGDCRVGLGLHSAHCHPRRNAEQWPSSTLWQTQCWWSDYVHQWHQPSRATASYLPGHHQGMHLIFGFIVLLGTFMQIF